MKVDIPAGLMYELEKNPCIHCHMNHYNLAGWYNLMNNWRYFYSNIFYFPCIGSEENKHQPKKHPTSFHNCC